MYVFMYELRRYMYSTCRKHMQVHHTCLRSILCISKMQRIRNTEIRERVGISAMRDMYELRRARHLHKIARVNAHIGAVFRDTSMPC